MLRARTVVLAMLLLALGPVTAAPQSDADIKDAGGVVMQQLEAFRRDDYETAFGYRFDAGGRSVAISGDTRPCENLMRWSRGVDVLVHECCEMAKTSWYPGCGWGSIEEKIRDLASYHTQPEDLGRVAESARPGRLVVSHLMPGSDPAELKAAAEKHYRGPVTIGEDLLEVGPRRGSASSSGPTSRRSWSAWCGWARSRGGTWSASPTRPATPWTSGSRWRRPPR